MNIKPTLFESQYDASYEHGNYDFGYYIRHEITVFNEIEIASISLNACWQTAQSYYRNDYNLPKKELELSDDGTHEALLIINSLVESDFENQETIEFRLEEVQSHCNEIETIEELKDIYDELISSKPKVEDYLNGISNDLNDYINDEDGTLTLKESLY